MEGEGNITMQQIQLSFIIFLFFCTSCLRAQQGYSGNSVQECDNQGRTNPSSSYLYTCNPQNISCQAFMIFRSQPRYTTVSTISSLLSVDPLELARINNVSDSYSFSTDQEVIIPVKCSCSGQYYQANTSYIIAHNDSYSSLANDLYQGLSSCSSLMGENPFGTDNLRDGLKLRVPLRCACPTKNQTLDGINYLLTYSLWEDDNIPDLSYRFNVSEQMTLSANGFSERGPLLYPSTTILIPLPREPLSSQTITHYPIQYSPSPLPLPFIPDEVKTSNMRLRVGIGTGVASLLVLCTVIPIACWYYLKWFKRAEGKKKSVFQKDLIAIADVSNILKVFPFEEIKTVTNNFSSECRIEGKVYRGMVRGSELAIKEMSKDMSKEVNILHKLNHFNLINLCGICIGEEHCYLAYEYMENGSLYDWFHDISRSRLLSWTQRVQIALDVANGLDYLHNFTEPPYVHKNIRSSNVLLNGNLRAKITNFSLARSSERREGGYIIKTTNIEGTFGYMAPEYLESGLVTPKLDVYALGVVMLELITGKDAIIKQEGREKLLSQAIISIVEGRNAEAELVDFMDSTIRGYCQIDLALAMAKLSVACLRQDPESRPNMDEVVSILLKIQIDSRGWGMA